MRTYPIWIGVVVTLTLGLLVWRADSRAGSTQDHAPVLGIRWGTTSVGPLDPKLGLDVTMESPRREGEKRALVILRRTEGEESPAVRIDAETGEVISDTLSAVDPASAKAALQTVSTGLAEPDVWPFAGAAEGSTRFAGIEYAVPHALSGVHVFTAFNFCETPCAIHTVRFFTSRSNATINADDGTVLSSSIDSADGAAFERLLATVAVSRPGAGE